MSVDCTTVWATRSFLAEKLLAFDGKGEAVFLWNAVIEKLLMLQWMVLLNVWITCINYLNCVHITFAAIYSIPD